MFEIIRFLIILLIIIFSIITLWVLLKTVIYFKKSKRLFKSSFNSTFKSLFSSMLLIIFFGVTFSVVAGTIQASKRIGNSLDDLLVDENLHFSYMDLDNIDQYREPTFTFSGEDEISKFLLEYFNFNPNIADLFLVLLAYKDISIYLNNDEMKNLLWKYELSYYMSNEASSWGYQYIALNNYNITDMLFDYTRGSPDTLDSYLLTDYKDSTLTQQTNSPSSNNENILVDDFEVVDSTPGGINDLFLDNNIPSSGEDYDVKVGVGADWAEANDVQVGDIISLPQPFGTNIQARVVLTFRAPQYIFPSFSLSKPIPNTKEQTYVLMNTKDFLNYFAPVANPTLFIGFSDLYNDVDSYDDYTSNIIQTRIDSYNEHLNKLIFLLFSNTQVKKFNNLNDYTAIRVETAFAQAAVMNLLTVVFVIFFLIIIIFILIVLIRKKITKSSREIGTLKAIGWTPQKIAVSYIAFPTMIILLGGVLAISLSFLVQFVWMLIWKRQFLISAGSVTFPLSNLLIIFVLPIVILLVVSYFTTLRLLKKPTLDLINDVEEYKPNILIKASNGVTSKFKNFMNSYRIKSMLRGIGKSTVLFTSVFFSILIISFALSGINVIKSGTTLINDTMQFDNAFVIDNEGSAELIEADDAPAEISYYTFVGLSAEQQAELLQIPDDENAESSIDLFFQNNLQSQIIGTTYMDRAQSFDALYGSYIATTNFTSSNMIIPWQGFELLNSGIKYVASGDSFVASDENTPLSTTGLTMGQYENIYNQYIKYYNYNSSLKDDDEDTIRPNVTMNKIIYDTDNEVSFSSSTFNWDTYVDSITNDNVTSIDDLDEHKVSSYDGRIYTREDYISPGKYGPEYVTSYREDGEKTNVSGKPTVDDFVTEINNSLPSGERVELNSPSSWDKNETNRTRYYDLDKYRQSVAEESDDFNTQWISFVDEYDDIDKIINFNDSDAMGLENYEQKDVQVISNTTGTATTVKTIPIIVDQHSADRLNVNVGDIYTSNYIDEENSQLYNNLRISGINSPIAVEVVGIYENNFPFGVFTLWQYLGAYGNPINPAILFQDVSTQKNYYAFTSYSFMDNTPLLNSFKNDDFHGDYDAIISKEVIQEQINFIATIIIVLFFVFSFFAAFIAISLISISIKEIANDAEREISTLKALGYSNKQSTYLIIMPYLLIMFVSFIIIIPINIVFFILLSKFISSLFGIGLVLNLGISTLQWMYILLSIFIFFIILIYIVYWTFRSQSPVEILGKD